jgi:hypothetical protein
MTATTPGIRRTLLLVALALLAMGSSVGTALAEPTSAAPRAAASTSKQSDLARHLRLVGAVFYGAWWCPHCTHQKEMFGSAALELLPYVECDKDDAGRQRCEAAQVRAYPTWVLKGERRLGVLSLDELALWSGYTNR